MLSLFRKKPRYFIANYGYKVGATIHGEGNIDIMVKNGVVSHEAIRFIRKRGAEILRQETRSGKHIKIQVIIRNLIEKDRP